MWDERYSKGDIFGLEPNDFLRSVSDRIPSGPVLCIGEGQGRNALFLAQRGFVVTAMDASTVGMSRAAELAAERGLSLRTEVGDLNHYAIGDNQWAAIISIFVHLPADLRRKVYRRIVAGLRPGGLLILEAYTPAQIGYGTGGPSAPALLAPLATLQTELSGLEFPIAHELERDVVEGIGHTGKAAVLQILARKPATGA